MSPPVYATADLQALTHQAKTLQQLLACLVAAGGRARPATIRRACDLVRKFFDDVDLVLAGGRLEGRT